MRASTNTIAFLQRTGNGVNGIWVLPMAVDTKPTLFLESRFTLWFPEFSPDGRWIAYVSNESGSPEVYVRPYPGPGEKIRISTAGGSEPIWTANGRELLYRSGTLEHQQFFTAIRAVSPFQAVAPRLLFDAKSGEYESTSPVRSWDVSAGGQRFSPAATPGINGQAGHCDARRAELDRRVEAPRADEVAVPSRTNRAAQCLIHMMHHRSTRATPARSAGLPMRSRTSDSPFARSVSTRDSPASRF
jgi:hypothetical protein